MKIFLIGYMFLFIYRPFEIYPILGVIHVERIWMIASLCFFFFSGKTVKQKIYGLVPVLFFFCVIALSYLVAADFKLWFGNFENYYKIFIFYFLLASSVDSYEDFFQIILAYIIIMFIYEAKSLYEYFFNGRHVFRMGIRRLMGVDEAGSDPNTMANSIIFSLPFVYAIYQDKSFIAKAIQKNLLLLFVVLSLICIIMTGSRTGAIGAFALAILVWLKSANKLKWAILLTVLVTVTWNFMPQEKRIRLESIVNPEVVLDGEEGEKFRDSARESAESRKQGFVDGYKLMELSPVLGHGIGGYKAVRYKVNGDPDFRGLQAHNMLGQLMGDLGLMGIVSFFIFVLNLCIMNIRVIKSDCKQLTPFSVAIIMSLAILFLNGFASHNLYRFNWLWLAAFSSIVYRINHFGKCRKQPATF